MRLHRVGFFVGAAVALEIETGNMKKGREIMKNGMTKKMRVLLALAAGLSTAGVASAEIELVPGKLKVDGFLDMSASYLDADDGEKKTMSFDQWEIDLHLAPVDHVSARIDIDDQPSAQEGAEVEQAFIVYDFEQGITAKAGKFLSALGYEGAEPTLLYQYSVSATIIGYPGYSSGAGAKYDFGSGSIYAAVLDGSYSGDNDAENVSPEVQLLFKPVEGLTLQAGYASEEYDDILATEDADGVEGFTRAIGNFWAEYKTGIITAAAEYNLLYEQQGADSDGDGYLVMVNFDWGKPALTLRHSAVELDNDYEDTEFTIAPNYQLAEPLLLVAEYRYDDYGDAGDANTFALELTYVY